MSEHATGGGWLLQACLVMGSRTRTNISVAKCWSIVSYSSRQNLCARQAQGTSRLVGFGAAYREKPWGEGFVWDSAWAVNGTSSQTPSRMVHHR
ncbi:hypothetical protein LZ32DRAFT_603395 [Colletotrichum eremochloae]|nr:hypothetical protein LZ32DRAFT_603395 [Colletotrichum eremochloae]